MNSSEKYKQYEYLVSVGDSSRASKLLAMIGLTKRVLEVGCASGSQTKALAEALNCVVVGIEIDPIAAAKARQYCAQVIVGDIEKLSLEELQLGQFDVVLFADVLEHLRDPATVLRNCRTLLSPEGCVVASVPNITHASIAYEIVHGNFDYRASGLLDDTHLRFFSRSSLVQMFESAGYGVEKLDRMIIEPANTEFATSVQDHFDGQFLRYVLDHNQEAKTYQFLVRAIPLDSASQLQAAVVTMRKEIESLEQELHRKGRELGQIRSENEWVRARPVHRILGSLRRLFPSRGR